VNVYVESNFVLEHALEQEECDTCAEIIRLASANRLKLVIPAFSLAEPHYAIFGKAKTRSRLGEDLRAQLGELGRSKPHREIPATFKHSLSALGAATIRASLNGLFGRARDTADPFERGSRSCMHLIGALVIP
jgi:hypothetical protein